MYNYYNEYDYDYDVCGLIHQVTVKVYIVHTLGDLKKTSRQVKYKACDHAHIPATARYSYVE